MKTASASIKAKNPDQKGEQLSSSMWTAMSGTFLALISKLTCPLCWPLYAGILSAMGVNFVDYMPYLFPFMLLLLGITIFALVFRAEQRRGYKPFYLGSIAVIMMLLGKFVFDYELLFCIGSVLLFTATIWNIWPKRNRNCQSCVENKSLT